MIVSLFKCGGQSSDWRDAEQIVGKIASELGRGTSGRNALIQGLKSSRVEEYRRFAKGISLPLSPNASGQADGQKTCRSSLPMQVKASTQQLTDLMNGITFSLIQQRHGGIGFSFWRNVFFHIHRVERWVLQQSAQSRIQAIFLMGFVPLVSLLMCLSHLERVMENAVRTQGQIIFAVAFILYMAGVLSVRLLLRRAVFSRRVPPLETTAGRMKFIHDLLSSAVRHESKNLQWAEACSLAHCEFADCFARRQLLGLSVAVGVEKSRASRTEEYLMHVLSSFVHSARGTYQWLVTEQSRLFEEFQTEGAQRAALLSLNLLFPMAIFFLPALFLILALCGFSMGGDGLN